jgi:hypothetical protein
MLYLFLRIGYSTWDYDSTYGDFPDKGVEQGTAQCWIVLWKMKLLH